MNILELNQHPGWLELDLTIRAADNRDIALVEAIVSGTLAEYGLKLSPESTDLDIHDIDKHYAMPGGFFVILKAGKMLGTAGLYRLDDERCELRKMYFQSELRGLGIGKQLLSALVNEARTRGFKRMELETASVLKEAIGLYQSFGFTRFTPEHLAGRCDQAYFLKL